MSELVFRLQEVEKDREHWKLEHQLSQIKLDKQHQGDQVIIIIINIQPTVKVSCPVGYVTLAYLVLQPVSFNTFTHFY